ncbi:ABC transporter ATP-binding protein [Brevibacillus choshinensis]|uniref:ABC transporter ATP-binding protein n=2 Tax=Brevibacillus choshinensis TaxID=54911 RepID=UPI002E21F40E|nr:ABC transporter ATP-binding protein [Brevibacillus choshinensis]
MKSLSLLEVNDLKIYYKTSRGISKAVDGVSFTVDQGRSIGLVGESGCGKSTLVKGIIRVLAGNGIIAGGSVRFEGNDLTQMTESSIRNIRWKDLSLIPQAAMDSLNPVYPVIDSFLEILMLKGKLNRAEATKRAHELFTMVGLDTKRLRYYPHEFSGGMKQRAMIALALALNPKLIIADEPVTALDVIVQNQVLRVLKNLKKELGLTLVMITHDISVVAETCDDVAVMYAGKIVEIGPVSRVLKNSTHPYTMGLANAFPNLKKTEGTLISIEGSPPDLVDPPKGCRFSARCPFKIKVCTQEEPLLVPVGENHFAACHRLDEIAVLQEKAKEVDTWRKIPS